MPECTVVPPGSMIMGQPGKLRRALGAAELDSIDAYARRYVEYKETYRAEDRMRGSKEAGN